MTGVLRALRYLEARVLRADGDAANADEARGLGEARGDHRGLALHDDLVAVFALRGRAGAVGQRDGAATVQLAGLEDEAGAPLGLGAVLLGDGEAEAHRVAGAQSFGPARFGEKRFG